MKLNFVAAEVEGLLSIATTTFANFESSHTPLHQTVGPVTQSDFNTDAFPKEKKKACFAAIFCEFCCDIPRVLLSHRLNAQYQIFLMPFYQ